MARNTADLTATGDVRKMLNGDGNHYRVADKFHHERGRYFVVRGDADLKKTFKGLVEHGTNYTVADIQQNDRGDFRAEIEREN